jgi:hypothetical protein
MPNLPLRLHKHSKLSARVGVSDGAQQDKAIKIQIFVLHASSRPRLHENVILSQAHRFEERIDRDQAREPIGALGVWRRRSRDSSQAMPA